MITLGKALSDLFIEASNVGGIKAKMRLAIITGIASTQADIIPDTQENIRKVSDALQRIKQEFKTIGG